MSQRIIRAWGLFEQALVQARKRYSSTLMARVYSSLPYLFETTLDRAAPGSGVQAMKGHDHTENGGRALPRNLVFSADVGRGDGSQSSPLDTASGLYYYNYGALLADFRNFHEWSGNSAAVQGQGYQFAGWVSPGIDTADAIANDTRDAALECSCIIAANQGTNVPIDFRWENVSEQASVLLPGGVYSSTVSVNLASTGTYEFHEVKFDDIPCVGGVRNKFNLQLETTATSAVWLFAVVCYESRDRSAPQSSASNNLRSQTF